jgi:hypothetical protein
MFRRFAAVATSRAGHCLRGADNSAHTMGPGTEAMDTRPSQCAGTDDRQHAERVTVELDEFAEALIKQPVIVADQQFPRQYSQGVIFWTNRMQENEFSVGLGGAQGASRDKDGDGEDGWRGQALTATM